MDRAEKKEKIRIAAYMRLSKEDGVSGRESNSITVQRVLIKNYVYTHFSSCEVKEYVDDGFSGTNFRRPGVQRLLEDARKKKIDCIVVKDLSRFGRDYIETGAYIEQIFPFLGVRVISINDRYDSGDYPGGIAGLDVEFKTLLYDLYSRDLSHKVKTSLQAKKESGQYVSANAPFGYEKAPDDRHMLIVKEDEAEIVQRIFSMALAGWGPSLIAHKLNSDKIPSPILFKMRKGTMARKPKNGEFLWSGSTVWRILHNPVYIGDWEYGKTERKEVGGRNVLKSRREWSVIKNHHTPVIEREDFEKAQLINTRGNRHLSSRFSQ